MVFFSEPYRMSIKTIIYWAVISRAKQQMLLFGHTKKEKKQNKTIYVQNSEVSSIFVSPRAHVI